MGLHLENKLFLYQGYKTIIALNKEIKIYFLNVKSEFKRKGGLIICKILR
nr:MAG TPA: hypothetical protein [Caudoviricetes sp.]